MDENLKLPERRRRRPLQSQSHQAGMDLAFPKLSPNANSEENHPNATVPVGHRTLGGQSIALNVSGNWAWNVRFSLATQAKQHIIRDYIHDIAEWIQAGGWRNTAISLIDPT